MEPLSLAAALKYYKRREVQEAIVRHAQHREVSPRYGEGFGKRPDVLENPADVLEFAKRRATSFHCSEERWDVPLNIVTGMSRKDADALRIGWDLVLDIDAKDWEISRLTAWLFVLALREHGVRAISAKFSGNKGWHVGVPFEAFASGMFDAQGADVHTSSLFPEMPRALAKYLVDYIGDVRNGLVKIRDDDIVFGGKVKGSVTQLARKAGKEKADLLEQYCPACGKAVAREQEQYALMCARCGTRPERRYSAEEKGGADDKELMCRKCGHVMDFHLVSRKSCPHNPSSHLQRFKITELVEFDTVLLASRHLYRMPYSLHEKSGLASVVIDPDDILTFKKELAHPDRISFTRTFLDPAAVTRGEASGLAAKAWERSLAHAAASSSRARTGEFEVVSDAIPEECFPPCMRLILAGLKDGKKRAMFALTNFLQVSGWPPEMIEAKLAEWNARNPEPLREVLVKGHAKQSALKKEKILPPNCMDFYRELGVCQPDDLCRTIRNPAQYALKKSRMMAGKKKGKRKKEENKDAPDA